MILAIPLVMCRANTMYGAPIHFFALSLPSLPYCCQRTSPEVLSTPWHLLEIVGLEPATYGLQSHRSSQLSYIPITRCISFLDTFWLRMSGIY